MRSSRQPTSSAPLIGGKNYRASDDDTAKNIYNNNYTDEVPLLRDGVAASSFSNRLGRVLQVSLILGVAAISLTAFSSTTMPDTVALRASLPVPLDSGVAQAAQAGVSLPAPLIISDSTTNPAEWTGSLSISGPLPMSDTSAQAVALSAPLGSSAQAVALSTLPGHTPGNRTFTVYTCGIPAIIQQRHVPFDICRVKLVGCPGGGAGCRHWRYEEGIEMIATGSASNAFTVTTDTYRAGKASTLPWPAPPRFRPHE
jgi:hypothetical protein